MTTDLGGLASGAGVEGQAGFGEAAVDESRVAQQTLRHLQVAFTNFFGKRAKYPRFKSRKKSRRSAEYTTSGFRFREGRLTLAKMAEPLDIVWSRPLPEQAEPSTVTVSQDAAGRWFVSLLCDDAISPAAATTRATDLASLDLWDAYTAAKVDMFRATDMPHAPWTVVKSNDKRRGRLEAMRGLLDRCDYPAEDHAAVGKPDPLIVGAANTLLEAGEEPTALSPTPLAGHRHGHGSHPNEAGGERS